MSRSPIWRRQNGTWFVDQIVSNCIVFILALQHKQYFDFKINVYFLQSIQYVALYYY
jgi:hypothetical protein